MNFKEYINSLPDSKEGIINLLREKGIKGYHSSNYDPEMWITRSCPLAELFKADGFPNPQVGINRVYEDWNTQLEEMGIPMSEGLQLFRGEFDRGMHPEFIKGKT